MKKPKIPVIENLKKELDALQERIIFLLRVQNDAKTELFKLHKIRADMKQSILEVLEGDSDAKH